MEGSELDFDYVRLLYCKCHKINPNRFSWLDKKTKQQQYILSIKKKYFQDAVTVALIQEEIGKNPQRITKIKPFINRKE